MLRTAITILKNEGVGTLAKVILAKAGMTVTIDGWVIPEPKKTIGFFLRHREWGVKRFIESVRPTTLITAGAYPGDYIAFAWNLGAKYIYGFEPEPQNYEYIIRLLEANEDKFDWLGWVKEGTSKYFMAKHGGRYIIVYNRALWSQRTKLRLGPCKVSKKVPEATKCVGVSGVKVSAVPLDEVRIFDVEPCIVVLDVEGSEIEVLRGARKLWGPCAFIIEVWPENMRRYIEWLNRHGFVWMRIDTTENVEYWVVRHEGK